jgi:methyl-accepting chemotaxis protein
VVPTTLNRTPRTWIESRPAQWLRALTRRSGRSADEADWRPETERIAADLEERSRSAERDFLAVGGRLMEFRASARRIAQNMAELMDLVAGGRGQDVPQTLSRLLGYVHEMDARFERNVRELAGVRHSAGRVQAAFCKRGADAQAFRTLCTLTRIETSRLGRTGAGFADLAEAVNPLSERLRSSAEGVVAAAERLSRRAQSSLESAEGLRGRQVRELRDLIAGVAEALKSFEERQRKASDASTRQAARYQAVCEAIDGVVQSIQFHDITRQQVEHIASALRQLSRGPAARIRPALRLQRSQLISAADTFGSALDRMERDMDAIARSARAMAEAGERLAGGDGGDRESFFLHMEGRCTAILKIAALCGAEEKEVTDRAAGLEETVEEMRRSVDDMRGIELQIQRIATNAAISAAHLGGAGDALNVIAEAMQKLAGESNGETEAAAEALDAIGNAAKDISGAEGDAGPVLAELRARTLDLHSSSEASYSRVSESATLGAQLSAEIQATLGGLAAGHGFARAMRDAERELERIGFEAAGPEKSGVGENVDEFASRYTMEREREVHAGVSGAAAPAAAAAVAVPSAAPGDLGENVELF